MKKIALGILLVLTLTMSVFANPSDWAEEEIRKAIDNQLVTMDILSDYQEDITREEFATLMVLLYESLSEEEAVESLENPFEDTNDEGILKAYNLNIIAGINANTFAPNQNITREQIASMLYRSIKVIDPSWISDHKMALTFDDKEDVSNWALESVEFINDKGIMGGIGNNILDPQGYTTREQAIALVNRTYEIFEKEKIPEDKILMGSKKENVIHLLGEPIDTIISDWGFSWYVFDGYADYIQVGIEEDQVVAIYTNSNHYDVSNGLINISREAAEEKYTNEGYNHTFDSNNNIDEIINDDTTLRIYSDSNDDDTIYAILFIKNKYVSYGNRLETSLERAKEYEKLTFHLTNSFRSFHNKAPLEWDDLAAEAARAHSEDMAIKEYFSHTNLEGESPFDRMRNYGINYWSAAENIAAGYRGIEITHAWINSSGHRDNILGDTERLGVGIYYKSNSIYSFYSTQKFYSPR
ncbi:uncharacterized protein YkwD [Natranaerovirga hydrolytica]|uniref:Uncharacterized protein YkwD n=1 Tax=Natranaerovirga hydrolytica TaxID=680378 RepID=A0A4V2Q1S5_9FIRM|nr:CAP domain-containing protein [Natranaerovirga hydrolytica]TCK98761.1 uncharacterized protein YkwD [Natranaerovirga hydrolytica]